MNENARLDAPAANVKAIIIAEERYDTTDLMTDHFGHTRVRRVAIGWRTGAKEDFRQLRRAAATFPETAHLGPGCDVWTATVVFATDVTDGANAYWRGQNSPWHRKPGGAPKFRTEADAQTFIAENGEPKPMRINGQIATFCWHVQRTSVEHRENWSMGGGNFLSDGGKNISGWVVYSRPWPCLWDTFQDVERMPEQWARS